MEYLANQPFNGHWGCIDLNDYHIICPNLSINKCLVDPRTDLDPDPDIDKMCSNPPQLQLPGLWLVYTTRLLQMGPGVSLMGIRSRQLYFGDSVKVRDNGYDGCNQSRRRERHRVNK
jgi:hypothetical protein